MSKMNKLCSNVDQSNPNNGGFTVEEKATMRKNIGFFTRKSFATSYDYPDCMHVRTPGANSRTIVYYPYEDRKKLLFVDGHVYNLNISTSGIQPEDTSVEYITARLFTLNTNGEKMYLCPSYTFKAGSSAKFNLNWVASNVLSISEASLDECAPHIEFNCILKNGADIAIYCNGLEWSLNEYSTEGA